MAPRVAVGMRAGSHGRSISPRWRDAEDWPLKRAQETRWCLHSGGRTNTINADGTLTLTLPDDVLVYASSVLPEDTEVTGSIGLRLWVASSARGTEFTGKLVAVHADGYAALYRIACGEFIRNMVVSRSR
jgi:predicted acyl esterase